jgi:hypothetical protein
MWSRVAFPFVAGFLTASAAHAAGLPPACTGDLAAVEASFNETIARLEAAGTADHAEKCAALHHHIDVMTNGRDVYLRCRPDDHDRGEDVAQLNASIGDFKDILKQQGCD